jgi:hypothetical protein
MVFAAAANLCMVVRVAPVAGRGDGGVLRQHYAAHHAAGQSVDAECHDHARKVEQRRFDAVDRTRCTRFLARRSDELKVGDMHVTGTRPHQFLRGHYRVGEPQRRSFTRAMNDDDAPPRTAPLTGRVAHGYSSCRRRRVDCSSSRLAGARQLRTSKGCAFTAGVSGRQVSSRATDAQQKTAKTPSTGRHPAGWWNGMSREVLNQHEELVAVYLILTLVRRAER